MRPNIRTKLNLARATLLLFTLLFHGFVAAAAENDPYEFDDLPLEIPLEYPEWFNEPFLDLPDDLATVKDEDKQGLIVYFGQQRCPYCKQLLEGNWGMPDIVNYTQKHFNVTPVNIWGIDELIDMRGDYLSERQFAVREGTNFTPSLIFYNTDGKEVFRLRGYYPPYQFRAALEYVAEGYYRKEPFNRYLARAENATVFETGDLNIQDFFQPPPYAMNRAQLRADRPLAVFFEQGECHACDVLHAQPLQDPAINWIFHEFDSVQLDRWADDVVITPDGEKTTAKEWADKLNIFYTPTIVFFDENGKEIIRVDSVVRFFRLRNVLNYIQNKGYLSEPNYQLWRAQNRMLGRMEGEESQQQQ